MKICSGFAMIKPSKCHVNSWICLGICSLVCLVAGCKNSHPTTPAQTEISQAEQDAGMSECKNGSKYIDNKCVCDDGSEWLGDDWFCILDGQRCYSRQYECTVGDKKFRHGSEYRNGVLMDRDSDSEYSNAKSSDTDDSDIFYLYINNSWKKFGKDLHDSDATDWDICQEEEGRDSCERIRESNIAYCEGIPGTSLRKDGKTTGDYKCRYDHWVCNSPKGCECFDGYETKKIQLGDFCENKIIMASLPDNVYRRLTIHCGEFAQAGGYLTDAGCKQFFCPATVDYWKAYKDYTSPGPEVCLDGNCPCGDGYCMKLGTCTDGICSCGNLKTNQHGDFYCSNYYAQWPYWVGGDYCPVQADGILVCYKEGGCHTSDGRHYPQYASIGYTSFSDFCSRGEDINYNRFHKKSYEDNRAYRDSLMYHIDAGFDTTQESLSILGECVLDRTDSIPRWTDIHSNNTATSEFICDSSNCPCNTQTCHLGEICRSGKCVADSCKAHKKTKPMCSVNIDTGYLDFINPFNTSQCTNISRIAFDENDGNRIFEDDICGISASIRDDLSQSENEKRKRMLQSESYTPEKYFDVIECKGGHRYCHGKNNSPIRIPDNSKGWECRDVTSLPGTDKHTDLKTWVCMNKSGCTCGKSKCEYSKTCIDNQCIDASLVFGECQGKPMEDGYQCRYTRNGRDDLIREIGMACNQSECACGNSVCAEGEICRNGRCIIGEENPLVSFARFLKRSDYNNYYYCINKSGCQCNDKSIKFDDECNLSMPCYGDGRLDKTGCICGDIKLNDVQNETCVHYHDQYYVLCNHPEGCTCGETKCPMSSYCSQNQCIDPLTGKPVEKSSVKIGLATSCTDEQCSCADSTCTKGQFCYGAACHDNIYANILHGKRYFYDERGIKFIETADQDTFDWNFIQSYDMSERNPENLPLDEYGFIPYYHSYAECCGGSESVFKEGELRCMLESGCACGNHSCPWGAQCIQGECVYDDMYTQFNCQSSTYSDVKMNGSNCECHGTIIPSYKFKHKKDYDCAPYGWMCEEESGCACGDTLCANHSYCVRPGLCSYL